MFGLHRLARAVVTTLAACTKLGVTTNMKSANYYTRAAGVVMSPAAAAVIALVVIQVGIGILYKASQSGGR